MSTLSEALESRKHVLSARIEEIESRMKNAPESRLRVSMRNSHPRFYEMNKKGDSTGKYLATSQGERARLLAQSDYDKKILPLLKKELNLVCSLDRLYKKETQEKEEFFSGPEELIAARMVPARRNMITPITLDQKAYVEKWLAESYERKGFSPDAAEYYTSSGIRVRSKTEWMIAEMLEKKKIPFYYERPLYLQGIGTIHPDFTVLNVKRRKTLYWEHMGMMDDETYRENALYRIEQYILNGYHPGIDLILTHETSARPIRSKIIEKMIDTYLLS